MVSELRNILIKVALLKTLKWILVYAKTIWKICIKKPGRKRTESRTIQLVGKKTDLMIGRSLVGKRTYPRNLVVYVHISGFLVPNVLIGLRVIINVMNQQSIEKVHVFHLHLTPIVYSLKIDKKKKKKQEGVLGDVIVSIYSWEYPAEFIVLQPKNTIMGHPFILGWPWPATINTYIGCYSGDMFITHRESRNKVTLYPIARYA